MYPEWFETEVTRIAEQYSHSYITWSLIDAVCDRRHLEIAIYARAMELHLDRRLRLE